MNGKPFKGRLGFDANNDKVVNLADPTDLQDGVNLRYLVATNTVQTFDPTRPYPAGFTVEYSNRLYTSKAAITPAAFNANQWTEIHAFGRWLRIVSNYTAEPGDNLLVVTTLASVTITMPTPEEGDIVTIRGNGGTTTNPIIVDGGTATFNTLTTTYEINSNDLIDFIYLNGTWNVYRDIQATYSYINSDVTLTPNSYNIIDTTANRAVTLPVNPTHSQWVTIVDGSNNAGTKNITVTSAGPTIAGSASYMIKRNSEQLTLVYNATAGQWVGATNAFEHRMLETLTPLSNQSVLVQLDATTKTINLPTGVQSGDWVDVVVTSQTETTAGQVIVAGNGASIRLDDVTTTTQFRIKKRARALFVYLGGVWNMVVAEDSGSYSGINAGSLLVRNSLYSVTGDTTSTWTLPSRDSVVVGDYISIKMDVTGANRVLVSVNDTVNDTIGAATTKTYTAVDNGLMVTFVFRGVIGGKNTWEVMEHGSSYLKKTDNLASLTDKAASRTNLDVFSKGESDARFLGINANAVSATQAANADKLDNLHAADFIQVKNPSATAVDANTTTETRFTTNLNTPNGSENWQVVMFVDTATGAKAQIAMGMTSNKIGYRAYSTSWSAWTMLDQSANAATASKLATARTITLTGDATGSVSFDGSANVNITTTVESAAVNLEDLTAAYASIKSGVFTDLIGTVTRFIAKDGAGSGFIIDIDNSTGNGTLAHWDGAGWVTNRIFTDVYHPVADKWTTARTITFTGGITGSAVIDGSQNVTINTTVDAGAHTHAIADVTGLQSALGGKLGSTATAVDSNKLGGVVAADYKKAVAAVNAGEDPDTTTTELILTNHANTPDGGTTYWYIDTKFYQTRSTGSNRFQIANQYNGSVGVQFRQYYNGTWSAWIPVAAIVDGETYNINISGSAGTASSAGTAGEAAKLTTPRNINGTPFDGTADVTVADPTKLPLTGGALTGTLHIRPAGNAALEMGRVDGVASTPFIDFHSGATAVDYDVRMIASDGDGTVGRGNLTIYALNTILSGGSLTLPNSTTLDGIANGLQITNGANGTVIIGNRNTSYTHYESSGVSGHYFYGNVTVQTTLTAPAINASGAVTVGSLNVNSGAFSSSGSTHTFNSWMRTTGQTGWYSQDYAGGIYMIDTTWVRVYNGKAFYVANEIAATGNITAYYSDKRLKENLVPIANALETVKSWTGYHYNANVTAQSFGYDPSKKEIGLLAQDVQATTPEAVEPAPFDRHAVKGKSLTGKHYLTLKYERLVPVLVEAIKEQDKEIQDLKEQVKYLIEKINQL